jgi:1-acyl-sn-glycerol-3-phosphate acyltransferase
MVSARPGSPGLVRKLVALFRGARLALHLLWGAAQAALLPYCSRDTRSRRVQRWCRALLVILNIRLDALSPPRHGGGMAVANHVSWLDIVVINAHRPAVFVAKSDVGGWPLIGGLCRAAQTVFVERARRQDAARVNRVLAGLVERGEWVVSFPEATTTDGVGVAHFHASLLQPCIDHGAALEVMALGYFEADGSLSRRAPFIGDDHFLGSLCRILCTPGIHAVLRGAEPLAVAGLDRRGLANAAQQRIGGLLMQMRREQAARFQPGTVPDDAPGGFSAYSLLLDNSLVGALLKRLP